ncbi:DegT/DnrJ/EryC1/StrS family aminotransferase [Motilimonas eburnea]|uniref:DegT/DnrJ/EryC1/StrS family aminotransferase n=1 Tax=Motilimonas eburnea TaxID=1737488 RepID=UPI001E4EA7FB|nr:aminotransferase class I/II-fold pyridoxal phosphate-dependent enzyme [Motilimonas eburnea]MCE2571528.1 aminotransferase class I/II-fold pyridoxal phosphate-dependent enzyme [Motilimonas eburnea]
MSELAYFGGPSLFEVPKSTSNLLTPDVEKFLTYSKAFYHEHQYTNNGPNVKALEQRLAEFHQVKHCLVFSSGFWALALAMKYLKLEGKTEVIMPSLTYRRMTDICAWAGLTPKFCEVDEDTLAMTAQSVEDCITSQTALILAAHPIVNCADAQALEDLSLRYNLPLLFDSVESVYEDLPQGRVGGFGAAECFSLHACKLINGFGGGYLTTNDSTLMETLAAQRTFGITGLDTIGVCGGFNAKLNEMHAAMALASLDDVDEQVRLNEARYRCYQERLSYISGIRLLEFDDAQRCGFKNIVAEIEDDWPLSRSDTIKLLNAENILARVYYDPPLHKKRMLFPHIPAALPISERLSQRFVNLPCGQQVSLEDIGQIIDFLEFVSENHREINAALRERCNE